LKNKSNKIDPKYIYNTTIINIVYSLQNIQMSINKENMNQNRNTSKTWIIVKESQKLDYIEYIINNNNNNNSNSIAGIREMETLISNFIDYTCEQKLLEAEKCRILIKEKQPENYDKIIYAANAIIYNYDIIIN
jgi:hypothetical protein